MPQGQETLIFSQHSVCQVSTLSKCMWVSEEIAGREGGVEQDALMGEINMSPAGL